MGDITKSKKATNEERPQYKKSQQHNHLSLRNQRVPRLKTNGYRYIFRTYLVDCEEFYHFYEIVLKIS